MYEYAPNLPPGVILKPLTPSRPTGSRGLNWVIAILFPVVTSSLKPLQEGAGLLLNGDGGAVRACRSGRFDFCQSEIKNLYPAIFGNKDVFRFEVTVHNSSGVSGG